MAVQEEARARLVGDSRGVTELRARIERFASVPANVLIVGESGSGKEVVARYLHDVSPRHPYPFVAVNCAAIVQELAESQLFGHERGSFTGAVSQHIGFFEAATRGTLFLDEIQDMPMALQVKLLRALETRAVVRVGAQEPVGFDTRIIAATNANPGRAVREGRLRQDLLFRLAAFALYVPPLRRRENDVVALAQSHVDRLNASNGTGKRLTPQSLTVLRRHPWPGNVRELHNTIERAFIMADGDLELEPLPAPRRREQVLDGALSIPIGATLAQAQQSFIAAALRHFGGDKPRTAKALGISLKTLYNRLALMTDAQTAQAADTSPA
ncbi:sigma-54-dependent Fis family transcriptional regulator [Pandoraea nosoerga]|uniref:Fis family transcriptional regulator n=1 Tax=Pandoraea nosoerga TaxID=2508296 RepID=A0A5E4SNU4_9BURK|nr:sigma-54 dependent transcriptional regulator [Pandoraea nosoerga]MBN4665217.1 sigma-54-dependent Fis family transcriptional regulator [Pandoraea nosoerga]MBN4674618.1 sigma-54-dependent Fis family transcriptional regulator [Pandoraea nosoerga]MBN4680506.1 sigma-54-dependent Fis family transcriptional regulator [Pandoraea nosoerga]MBN4743911.1 sigma-54-dependent Fis family transcriptional regulator [Pandoraea nosoerga]VVD76761.1 Fis family transcriptional regulator [Pandoraea nosoerga]